MTIYGGPNKEAGGGKYSAKFVRVEETISTTEPFVQTIHRDLALKDGIYGRVQELRQNNPDEVDGGQYLVEGQTITIFGTSSTFNLPWTQVARERTAQVFRSQSEGYEVKLESFLPLKEVLGE